MTTTADGQDSNSYHLPVLLQETLDSLAPSPWRWLFPTIILVLSLLGLGTSVYVGTGGWPLSHVESRPSAHDCQGSPP